MATLTISKRLHESLKTLGPHGPPVDLPGMHPEEAAVHVVAVGMVLVHRKEVNGKLKGKAIKPAPRVEDGTQM